MKHSMYASRRSFLKASAIGAAGVFRAVRSARSPGRRTQRERSARAMGPGRAQAYFWHSRRALTIGLDRHG